MNSKTRFKINKKAVADAFSKAAEQYDQFAGLQQDVGVQLLATVRQSKPMHILDLGCGTGFFTEKLCKIYPECKMTALDLSPAMLRQAAKKQLPQVTCVQGDIDNLNCQQRNFDLIFSNLVVQWSADLGSCLQQLKHQLRKGGTLYFSTLLNDSLYELTQAWKTIDTHPHTNTFLSLDIIKDKLQQCGFQRLKIKTETRILHYQNVIDVMRALKGIGANHVHGHQALALTGRKTIRLLEKGYTPFVNKQGQLNLTYKICYVEAQK